MILGAARYAFTFSAASVSVSGYKCRYVFAVRFTLAWPINTDRSISATPAENRALANRNLARLRKPGVGSRLSRVRHLRAV